LGHHDIILRGITLFDELIIAIGINAEKKYMFSLEQRMQFIAKAFEAQPKIKVAHL
jgi:pantetheine-phosphate adenylyltransferase